MAPESTPGASPMASQDLKAENSADEAREVPVSEQTLLKAISWDTKFKNKSVEEVDEVMAQVTHLKLHGLSPPLTRVDDLTRFKALSVLYLYDNKINHIGSLAPCQDLTHLYLQNNNLESTEMIQVSTRDEARRPFSSFPALPGRLAGHGSLGALGGRGGKAVVVTCGASRATTRSRSSERLRAADLPRWRASPRA